MEISRIQMLALIQHCLDHCQPARSYFLKRQRPAPYSVTGDQQLFAKSTMRLVFHFTLFSDGAKHHSFPTNFPTCETDWQITILLTDDRQDNITRGRNSSLKCLSTGSLPTPFPRYFFPKQRACSQASSPPTRRDLTMLFSILFVSLSLKSPIRRNNN